MSKYSRNNSDNKENKNKTELILKKRVNSKLKRKSLPLLQFEKETIANDNRSRSLKRRYSDISELKSSLIKLNELEIDRSISPHNKRRRISDISDVFQTDKHSMYTLQAIANVVNMKKLNHQKLTHFVRKTDIQSPVKIREIINEKDVIIVITKLGLAAAFNRRDLRHLCYLNGKKERVKSLFYNKCDNSFIICSSLNEVQLVVKTIPLRRIELGNCKGRIIFETETIAEPGWLEYEDKNNRVLTFDHTKKIYKLWDLNSYSCIYSFRSDMNEIEDVKISNDGLIQIGPINHKTQKRKITIRSLNENKIITCFEINAPEMKKHESDTENETKHETPNEIQNETQNETKNETYDFIEYHFGYLYVKYGDKSSLNVFDCRDKNKEPKILNSFPIPDAYLFLRRCNRLLYYNTNDNNNKNGKPSFGYYGILDLLTGEQIELKRHISECYHKESVMFITKNQTKMVYYSKFINVKKERKEGIIQINSLEDGQLFGYIMCNDNMMQNKISLNPRWCLPHKINKERRKIFVKKNPLKRITAIHYNDIHNEIYTADRTGKIHIWA